MSGSAGGRAEQDLPRRAPHRAADPTAWLGRCRRLSKDYEYLRVCSENTIYLTMAMLLVRRLARPAR
jgi:transposase